MIFSPNFRHHLEVDLGQQVGWRMRKKQQLYVLCPSEEQFEISVGLGQNAT